jgi:hypothetical protein
MIMEAPTKYRIGFWINLFIAIDQLGNAIAAGYADTIVSARVVITVIKSTLSAAGVTNTCDHFAGLLIGHFIH